MREDTASKKNAPLVRSLPTDLWPMADGRAWEEACRPSLRLRRGGAASHLRAMTQNDLARRYGYFLDFLSRSDLLDMTAGPAAQVIPQHVDAYVAELKTRVGSVTSTGRSKSYAAWFS